jgi:hypothetical protein
MMQCTCLGNRNALTSPDDLYKTHGSSLCNTTKCSLFCVRSLLQTSYSVYFLQSFAIYVTRGTQTRLASLLNKEKLYILSEYFAFS